MRGAELPWTEEMEVNFATTSTLKDVPEAVTLAEFGNLFGKNYLWAYRLMQRGKIKTITGFGNTMVPKDEALRIINQARATKLKGK